MPIRLKRSKAHAPTGTEPGRGSGHGRGLDELVPEVPPAGCPTLARLEREARAILERLRRIDAADGDDGTRWSPEAVEGLVGLLTEFDCRLETLMQLDHDPAALPEVLATRRWIAQAQLIVVGRLTDLCGE